MDIAINVDFLPKFPPRNDFSFNFYNGIDSATDGMANDMAWDTVWIFVNLKLQICISFCATLVLINAAKELKWHHPLNSFFSYCVVLLFEIKYNHLILVM